MMVRSYVRSGRIAGISGTALVAGGCILLVNEVPEGQGGSGQGGGPTSGGSTVVTASSTTGAGGEAPTCPGLAAIESSTIASPPNAVFDDVAVRGQEVLYTARGEIHDRVPVGTFPAFVVYADAELVTSNMRQLVADGASGTVFAPLAVYDDNVTLVHSSGNLYRVLDDVDPGAEDVTPIRVLRQAEVGAGKLYAVEDGLGEGGAPGGAIVEMTVGFDPLAVTSEVTLHEANGTYVEAFDYADDMAVWADAGIGAPQFCQTADCNEVTVMSPYPTTAIAVGQGRAFTIAPGSGRGSRPEIWAFDFVDAVAHEAFRAAPASDQGVQAVAVTGSTVVFTRRPDMAPVNLVLVRCCAAGAYAELVNGDCSAAAELLDTGDKTTRKIVPGPGDTAVTLFLDGPQGQEIRVIRWDPSPP